MEDREYILEDSIIRIQNIIINSTSKVLIKKYKKLLMRYIDRLTLVSNYQNLKLLKNIKNNK